MRAVGAIAANTFREAIRDLDSQDGIRMQVQRDGARRYVFLRSR